MFDTVLLAAMLRLLLPGSLAQIEVLITISPPGNRQLVHS
jgi:hypothetical protein